MSNSQIGPFSEPIIPRIGVQIGAGSKNFAPSAVKPAILEAIRLGYRHIQVTIPGTPEQHQASQEAIAEALNGGLINSREELFISCRFEYNGAGPDTITNDLRTFLESQQLSNIDLLLIKWLGDHNSNPYGELIPVWTAMEECQNLGLTNFIGVCDFSMNTLENLFNSAALPPFANQVGMQVFLTGKELRKFCEANQISMIVISTIGRSENEDFDGFEELEGLQKIAKQKKKTTEETVHRWVYDQRASLLLESLRKEDMEELLSIRKWNLSGK